MRRRLYISLFFLSHALFLFQQPYAVEKGNTRHRFAQTVLGIDLNLLSGGDAAYLNEQGTALNYRLQPSYFPSVHISGLHFWGHTEFYFNIPLSKGNRVRYNNICYNSYQADIFGARFFPFRVKKQRVAPFVGVSASTFIFRQFTDEGKTKGPLHVNYFVPLSAGFTWYKKGGWMLEAGATISTHKKTFSYYLNKTQEGKLNMQQYGFWLGIRKVFETTIASEKAFRNGLTEKRFQRLKELKKLNSFFFGAGPSSAFFTGNQTWLKNERPYINRKFSANIFPEAVSGYYFARIHVHVLAAGRYNTAKMEAYGTEVKMKRLAAGAEAHVQLFDYNGFVPFIGLNGGYEKLMFTEKENGQTVSSAQREKFAGGLVIGWDILPDKIQPFTLRTNLRYFPDLSIKMEKGYKISLDQFELNFIQMVYYPGRAKWIKRIAEEIQE